MTRIEYFYDFYTNLELWDVTITFPNYNPNFKVCEQQQMPDREMKRITKADFMPRIVLSFELVCELVTRLHLRNIWLTDINKIGGINRKKETNVLPIPKEFEQIEYLTFGYYDTVRSIPQ